MAKKSWSTERIEILRKMSEDGCTIKEICKALNVTRAGVNYARKRYCLFVLKHWSEKEDNRLRELVTAGKSNVEIAAELDRTVKAVQLRKNIIGIKVKNKIGYDECIANLKKRYNLD